MADPNRLSPLAGSPLHAIAWVRPAAMAPRPKLIELAVARIQDALGKRGGLYAAMMDAPIHRPARNGGPPPGAGSRIKAVKSDLLQNFTNFLITLVLASDIKSGLIASPANGQWTLLSFRQLDGRAFGPVVEGERSYDRTERYTRIARDMGILAVDEICTETDRGLRASTAVKHVTDEFWSVLGIERARKKHETDEHIRKVRAGIAAANTRSKVDPNPRPAQPERIAGVPAITIRVAIPLPDPGPPGASSPDERLRKLKATL